MPRTVPERRDTSDSSRTRDHGGVDSVDSPPPLPLHHHPLISGSVILVAGAVVQIGVGLMSMKLPGHMSDQLSSVVVHGLLLDPARSAWPGADVAAASPGVFAASLLLSLFSGIAWYAVARLGLGPRWGLWVGLFWVVHPSFAFVANRPGRLILLIALLPAAWCLLLLWRRRGSLRIAVLFGAVTGLTCLAGFQGFVLVAVAAGGMLLSANLAGTRRLAGVAMAMVGLGLCTVIVLGGFLAAQVTADMVGSRVAAAGRLAIASRPAEGEALSPASKTDWRTMIRYLSAASPDTWQSAKSRVGICLWFAGEDVSRTLCQMLDRADNDLWNALDDGSETSVAVAAARERSAVGHSRPPAVRFLANEYRRSPREVGQWFVTRFWKSIYATPDGRFLYPLVLLQFAWLVPAVWGFRIAVTYRPWRWLAIAAGMFSLAHWALVAIAEPLARNLTPIGGFAVLFALVGVTDVYERFFGRRLTAPAPASRPARLRRMQRNLDAGDSP